MKLVPLYRKNIIVHYAQVDDEDYVWAIQWRWGFDNKPYATRGERRLGVFKRFYLHVEIAKRAGIDTTNQCDHLDRYKFNCQRFNLRAATCQQNGANRSAQPGSSLYKGVSWQKADSKWKCYVCYNRKQTHLGLFTDEVEAAKAYDKKALELFGEYAHLNFPIGV